MIKKIAGGKKYQKDIAKKTIEWCMESFSLDVAINIKLEKHKDCWGYCLEASDGHPYTIMIATNQSIRDFVATIVHEMIHVMQWETGVWKGSGEREANRLQFKLTDKIWKENII